MPCVSAFDLRSRQRDGFFLLLALLAFLFVPFALFFLLFAFLFAPFVFLFVSFVFFFVLFLFSFVSFVFPFEVRFMPCVVSVSFVFGVRTGATRFRE